MGQQTKVSLRWRMRQEEQGQRSRLGSSFPQSHDVSGVDMAQPVI